MCSAFLWLGSPTSTKKAKVACEDVCKPRNGGRFRHSSRVFALSVIWRLLTNSGSLWVAWTRRYLLRHRCFWDVSDKSSGSWIWCKRLKLWKQAATYLHFKIHSGKDTLFWFDNWLSIGRLIDVTGKSGTQALGIGCYAKVAAAATSGGWNLRQCRSYHIREMVTHLTSVTPPVVDAGSDRMLWCHGDNEYKP